jgi:hypothetical protein
VQSPFLRRERFVRQPPFFLLVNQKQALYAGLERVRGASSRRLRGSSSSLRLIIHRFNRIDRQ